MGTATLTGIAIPPKTISFDINPEQIQMTRNASLSTRPSASSNSGTPSGASASIFKKSPAPMITMNKVIFYGDDVKSRCETLFDWMSPGGGLLGALVGAAVSAATGGAINLLSKPPMVIFSWGPPGDAFFHEGIISGVTVRYDRFAPSGTPIRAELTIKMQEQPSLLSLLATNPTSAGLPGRKAHTMTSGESLVGIATSQYGSPGQWRSLATANNIDDPLRVRPGHRVYLPNPGEMERG